MNPLQSPSSPLLYFPLPHHKIKLQVPPHALCFTNNAFNTRPTSFLRTNSHSRRQIKATAADGAQEIDMVRNREGVYTSKAKKVAVLWDLDNKPPRGRPYEAAISLKQIAQRFGEVVDISAYANRHAFVHLPHWVVEQRRERRHLDILERKGVVNPHPGTYTCGMCGRKCKTNLDLKKHFRQLHERERQKKFNRMKSLKGQKRQKFKERFIDGNDKYVEAAKNLITPKVGYGLASELRRAGVYVKTVEDKPQAADWALKRQMQHSLSQGTDWLFLVSDDSDFLEMLRRARESGLGTVVVGDADKALGRYADLWIPWVGVENGEISEKDLSRRRKRFVNRADGFVEVTRFDGGDGIDGDLGSVVEELVGTRTDFHSLERNAFSDGEEEGYQDYDEDHEFIVDVDDEEGDEDYSHF